MFLLLFLLLKSVENPSLRVIKVAELPLTGCMGEEIHTIKISQNGKKHRCRLELAHPWEDFFRYDMPAAFETQAFIARPRHSMTALKFLKIV